MKRKAFAALLLLTCLLLSGCVSLSVNLQQVDGPDSLVIPTPDPIDPALGDTISGSLHDVTLYYVSASQQRLVPLQYTLVVHAGETLLEKVISALIKSPLSTDMRTAFPAETRVLDVERSGNVAVVNLSIDARSVENELQLLWMRMSLAATLTRLENIEYVHLLIGGREEGLLSMPSGAYGATDGNITAAWAGLLAERGLLADSREESAYVERTAILYYASRDGRHVVPVAQKLRLETDDFVTPVIRALLSAPDDGGCLRSPFPAGSSALTAAPEMVDMPDRRRMLRLIFDANLPATLEREGLNAWQLYASLTYTITGFVPNVDGLIVVIGDGLLTRAEWNGDEIAFIGGEMNRADYPGAVGSRVNIYLSAADGGLVRLDRVLDQANASSPRALLREVFAGPEAWETEAACVLPGGVSIDDVVGTRVRNDEAVISLSSNLYRCCQGLNAQQERNLIYALVNTLTELPDVSAVRFQLEGEPLDTLVSAIFLRGPLMRNPGLIRGR